METATARADVPLGGPNRDDHRKFRDEDESASITATPPISHREKRKAKKRRPSIASIKSTISPTTLSAAVSKTKPKAQASTRRTSVSILPSLTLEIEIPSMPPGKDLPLFIASLGNPAPKYTNTLHSAGHTVLTNIARIRPFKPFTRDRLLGNGFVARPDTCRPKWTLPRLRTLPDGELAPGQEDWLLWQSPSLMNVSGKALVQAWKTWAAGRKREGLDGGLLVVVHDELEAALGKVSVRRGGSAKGHNGVKSVQASFQGAGGMRYEDIVRVGIGIGRPESREPSAVSQYVLRKMTARELDAMDRAAGDVIMLLRDVAEGKR